MAERLDAIFFDIDDTLFSTSEFAERARRASVEAMINVGLKLEPAVLFQELSEVVAEFTSNYDQHLDRLLDRLGLQRGGGREPAVLIAAGVIAYHQTKERDLKPLPDAVALLRAIHQARVRAGIVSAGLHVKQAEKLVRLGVLPWLDPGAIFFSDQMGVSKPNPKIFAKACAAMRLPPGRVMYVGDRPETDIAPARRVGMKCVHYRGAHGRYSATPANPPADHEVQLLTDLRPILRDVYALAV